MTHDRAFRGDPLHEAHADDSGAVLLFALVIVTVIAVVISVVLTFADTSLRTTVALRGQASSAANADGAAEAAVNALRNGSYNNNFGQTGCFKDSTGAYTLGHLTLPNFYQQGTQTPDSAAVYCSPDAGSGAAGISVPVNNQNRPGNAILTLGTDPGETGINVKISGGGTAAVRGRIWSHSTIKVTPSGSVLALVGGATAYAQAACSGTITPPPFCNFTPLPGDDRGDDPLYVPAAPSSGVSYGTPVTVPVAGPGCHNQLFTFSPGHYTNGSALSLLMSSNGCKNSTFVFTPGTYYFDFGTAGGAADTWTVDTGSLVAGQLTTTAQNAIGSGAAPSIPGACVNPFPAPGAPADPNQKGVQFVFGGDSQLVVKQSHVEICGTYGGTAPPAAVYGLRAPVDLGGSPDVMIPAESGCVVAHPYAQSLLGTCALILTTNAPGSQFYVQGTTYAPKAALDVGLNNLTGQVFKWGVVSRVLDLTLTGSVSQIEPVIEVPDDSPGYAPGTTVVFLDTYVCPAASTCDSSNGVLRLRSAVAITDPNPTTITPGARQITVETWSAQR